jgi:putative transposase
MPRPLRPVADGLLYHAINRGNNRAAVFRAADDYRLFLTALNKTKERYPFRLYGYCLMTNHFHLLLAPEDGVSISRVLQSLAVAHTWHYHRRRGTVGHVWQGRFKSPVVQDDDHALVVLRYIEANPLRAGMVADLADYPWSSYGFHGLGRDDALISPLPAWEALGQAQEKRRSYWKKWVHTPLAESQLAEVRRSMVSGRPFGTVAWAESKATVLGPPPAPKRRGRPPKNREKMN